MAEERGRLGYEPGDVALAAGITTKGLAKEERGESSPAATVLAAFAFLGADVQYILTGTRSVNMGQIAEEAGVYEKKPQGVGVLSREEEALVKKYRQLDPGKRTHAQAVVDALASATVKKDKAG